MSEEVNQEQEAVSEVTPETPTINLDSTIQVDGEEVSVQDLLNSRQENLDLKQYNEQAKMLINPNAGDNESNGPAKLPKKNLRNKCLRIMKLNPNNNTKLTRKQCNIMRNEPKWKIKIDNVFKI